LIILTILDRAQISLRIVRIGEAARTSYWWRMKYSQLRRGLSPEDAAAYVGSKELLRQFERAKWLKPFIRGNRLTRFDIRDLDGCIDRLKAGELLPHAKAA
jgi:hypothetical protein